MVVGVHALPSLGARQPVGIPEGSDDGLELGAVETLGHADGGLEGPVAGGSDVGPEEGALLKLGMFEGDNEGRVEGPSVTELDRNG